MSKKDKRMQRKRKVRAKVSGTKERPRLSVYRSNKNLFVQLINDEKDETLVSLSSRNVAEKDKEGKTKVEIAGVVGEKLARKAMKKKIKKAVFDRGGYQYHGRIKAVAEGARKGGLEL